MQIDCSGIFAPGQLAVAVGRATSSSGLRLVNFNPKKHLITPSIRVQDFYLSVGLCLDRTLNCCSQTVPNSCQPEMLNGTAHPEEDDTELASDDELVLLLAEMYDEHTENELQDPVEPTANDPNGEIEWSDTDTDSDSDKEEETEHIIPYIYSHVIKISEETSLPPPFFVDAPSVLKDMTIQCPETTHQHTFNANISYLLNMDVQSLADNVLMSVNKLWQKAAISEGVNHVPLRNFYSSFHQYRFNEFETQCTKFLGPCTHLASLTSELLIKLRGFVVDFYSKKKMLSVVEDECEDNVRVMSQSGKGKIRYLAGRCIAMAKKNILVSINNALNSKKNSVKALVNSQRHVSHLNHLRTTFHDVSQGIYQETLEEVERRQNWGGGLTHVTDQVFEFFFQLETNRMKLHNMIQLAIHSSKILCVTTTDLLDDIDLRSLFEALFDDMIERDEDAIQFLYEKLVQKFMTVANNEFRKYVLEKIGKIKKHAHRMEIFKRKKQKQAKSRDKMLKECQGEVAANNNLKSEKKRKRETGKENDEDILEGSSKSSYSQTKRGKGKPVCEVKESNEVVHDHQTQKKVTRGRGRGKGRVRNPLNEAETAKEVVEVSQHKDKIHRGRGGRRGRGLGRSKGRGEKNGSHQAVSLDVEVVLCPVCKAGGEELPWIQCDFCNIWYHKTCSQISSEEEWNHFQKEGVRWKCIECGC